MSAEEAKPEEKPEEKKALTYEEILDALVKDSAENKKNINMMAQAIVKLNEKIEGLKAGGGGNPQQDLFGFLAKLAEKKEGGELDAVVRGVENLARVGDALDRIRSRGLGVGEAMLMRLGMRAAYPRYMTKAEITRLEREAGIFEALAGKTEGESESEGH